MEEEGITTVEIITTAVDIDANTTARSKYNALYMARHVHIAIVLPSCRSHQFKSHGITAILINTIICFYFVIKIFSYTCTCTKIIYNEICN